MKNSQIFITSLRNEVYGVLLITALWGVASLFYPPYIIPSPLMVLTGTSSFLPVDFAHHLWLTFVRVISGFSLAFIAGTCGGIVFYWKKWGQSMNTLMMALQVAPGTILGVIFLLIFGIGSATPIMLVTFLTLPTLAINTLNSLSKRNKALEEYLISIHSSRWGFIRYLYFPAFLPVLQSNLSLGLSMAVKVVVLGEFIGSQDGLGYLLNNAHIFFNMKEVFFYLSILLLFTLVFQALQSLFFSLLFQKYGYAE